MTIWFGSLVDDPGLGVGQAVLPQFAYVALTLGALLPAGVFVVLTARSPDLLPRWLAYAGYPVGVLVAFSAVLFIPMFLFLAWMIGVVVFLRGDPVPE
jgi:hypothetical protein